MIVRTQLAVSAIFIQNLADHYRRRVQYCIVYIQGFISFSSHVDSSYLYKITERENNIFLTYKLWWKEKVNSQCKISHNIKKNNKCALVIFVVPTTLHTLHSLVKGLLYYLECQSVRPVVWIVSPTPSPASKCGSLPLGSKGGATLACRGGGGGSDDWTVDRHSGTLFSNPLTNSTFQMLPCL
jgi:hypothetical protein